MGLLIDVAEVLRQHDYPRATGFAPVELQQVLFVSSSTPTTGQPCRCECNPGGFCGGCGFAGCGQR